MRIDVSGMRYQDLVHGAAKHYFELGFSFKRYGTSESAPVVLQVEGI